MTAKKTPLELAREARARADATPKGPWKWFGNTKTRSIYLATDHSGRVFVMDFERWGPAAAPRFQENHRMIRADEFVEYEVAPVRGVRNLCPQVYRQDFIGLDHPVPKFLAAARSDVSTLCDIIESQAAEIERLRAALKMPILEVKL